MSFIGLLFGLVFWKSYALFVAFLLFLIDAYILFFLIEKGPLYEMES